MSQSNPDLPTAVYGLPTHLSIYLPIDLSSTLANQSKKAYGRPGVYGNTPQGRPKPSKNFDWAPQDHAGLPEKKLKTFEGY